MYSYIFACHSTLLSVGFIPRGGTDESRNMHIHCIDSLLQHFPSELQEQFSFPLAMPKPTHFLHHYQSDSFAILKDDC